MIIRTAMEKPEYSDTDPPLWPVVPSSLYGAFLAGKERDARVLIITFDSRMHCLRGDPAHVTCRAGC